MLISLFTGFKYTLILPGVASREKSFFIFFMKLMIVSQHVTNQKGPAIASFRKVLLILLSHLNPTKKP